MANTLKDVNAVINVGGALTHWNGMAESGGELVAYDKTPVGGPPATDYNSNVRAPLTLTLTTRIVGADVTAMETVITAFAKGTVFSGKAAPSGSSQMGVTGADVVGHDFTVTQRTVNHQFQGNAELTVVLTESGPTPA